MTKRRSLIILGFALSVLLIFGSFAAFGTFLNGLIESVGDRADAESYDAMLRGYTLGAKQTFDAPFVKDGDKAQYFTEDRVWKIVSREASHSFSTNKELRIECVGSTDAFSFESNVKDVEYGTDLVFSVDLKTSGDAAALKSRFSIKVKDAEGVEKSVPLFMIDSEGDVILSELQAENIIYPEFEITRLSNLYYKTIRCELSLETRQISVYVDGRCVISGGEFIGLPEGECTISRAFYFYGFNGKGNVGASIELDNVEYYYKDVIE